jgi:SAM-dependent methyltransferase
MVAVLSNQRDVILDAVRRMYTDVAKKPGHVFHFPTGRPACVFVGYPAAQLDVLPSAAVESFAGVGYPFAAAVIREGDTVLDIGSGSGTDTLIASRMVGRRGRVIGLDMTPAMHDKLRVNAAQAGIENVDVLLGSAEDIPLPDASVDVVTTNGVLNLVPDKARTAREIGRVLRPGGRLQLADIVVDTLPSEACRSHPELWAECVVGATRANAYLEMFAEAGLVDLEVLTQLDYFAGSSSPETQKVAGSFGAHSIVLRGRLAPDGKAKGFQ